MCRHELSLPGFVDRNGFLITRDSSGVIAQSLLSKTQTIQTFHVRRVDMECGFKLLSCNAPIVLDGE